MHQPPEVREISFFLRRSSYYRPAARQKLQKGVRKHLRINPVMQEQTIFWVITHYSPVTLTRLRL